MITKFIKIKGARVHNLKNINVNIPRNKLVVITGISGSGKSSLAFDTLYAEGQRRYVESLSAYARQFLGIMDKPDCDKIEGISPAIAINQKNISNNPRSTVGTITEVNDYLRLLFSRIGTPHCPHCKRKIQRQTIDQIIDQILALESSQQKKQTAELLHPLKFSKEKTRQDRNNNNNEFEIIILGPVIRQKKGEHKGVIEEIERMGFLNVRIDGKLMPIEEAKEITLDKQKKHSIEVVVDRLNILNLNSPKYKIFQREQRSRIADSVETALKIGKGVIIVNRKPKVENEKVTKESFSTNDIIFSEHFACPVCGISLPEMEPRFFSFNSPIGACHVCSGLGEKLEVDPNLVVPNKNLSLAEGAIYPWARASHKIGRQSYFWWKLQNLASEYNFSVETPFKNLPKNIQKIILYGKDKNSKSNFEGVIPFLERKWGESEGEATREEIEQYMREKICPDCQGKRLKPEVLAVTIKGKSIDDISKMNIKDAKIFFEKLIEGQQQKSKKGKKTSGLTKNQTEIAQPIIKEILNRLSFLEDVGLDYLTLERRGGTLSNGEGQRIRLATQIGSKLVGVTYILDEPSIGLHSRDQGKLIESLKKLRDLENNIIVVEHDPQTILKADYVIEIGPKAGKDGGKIVFEGTPKELLKSSTLTGEYLSQRRKVEIEKSNIKRSISSVQKYLILKGAKEHNLKNIDVKFPLKKLICVTGVSGSGKSTLINDILARALMKKLYRSKTEPGKFDKIMGVENIKRAAIVDQSPIGKTPRSNPVTYIGAFNYIREIFAETEEAKVRGYLPGRFSFNVRGGRCEACQGQGVKKVEMYFLPDIYVECEECKGKRYNQETLEIEYKGKNIADILSMTVDEALSFFRKIPGLERKLRTLKDVGLGYVQLGQPAPSLSGGEAQRVKLAEELSKIESGDTLYILDEPTVGLHSYDIQKLLLVLQRLVDRGNTVIVIEHNLDFIKNADWILDLGPEGGDKGGYIIAEGPPEKIAKNKKSWTGQYLRKIIDVK
jgi:excinuclease ABC subunit A